MVNCRDKSGDITDHAAPETNDERLAIQSRSDHLIANRAGLFECLRFLSRWNRDQRRLKASRCQTSFDSIREQRSNIIVRNNCTGFCSQVFAHVLPKLLEQALASQAKRRR